MTKTTWYHEGDEALKKSRLWIANYSLSRYLLIIAYGGFLRYNTVQQISSVKAMGWNSTIISASATPNEICKCYVTTLLLKNMKCRYAIFSYLWCYGIFASHSLQQFFISWSLAVSLFLGSIQFTLKMHFPASEVTEY